MDQLKNLIESIITRVNVNLHEFVDVGPHLRTIVSQENLSSFYAFYGLTPTHPLHFKFSESCLSGTYFLGKCEVTRSVLYKSDIRGDELKRKGDVVKFEDMELKLYNDEFIAIRDSFLIKTLVHNKSHDPENLEKFAIRNTVALHWANIHGAPMDGCFLEPFATVDLTSAHNCAFGTHSYVQAGELSHTYVEPGRIWVKAEGAFEFDYKFPREILDKYVKYEPGKPPTGKMLDYVEERKADFIPIYSSVTQETQLNVPGSASLSPYAVVKGNCSVDENVLVCQRAYLEEASLGQGANAQENCYIVHSRLDGMNVTAHGGKIIHAHCGPNCFVGFNAFVHGTPENPVQVGKGCIIMPHTIIDADEPLEIPDGTLVWGFVGSKADLERNSIAISRLKEFSGETTFGDMSFSGSGKAFVDAFAHRIQHILEENGAYFESGDNGIGHAQQNNEMSFNIVQPYPDGPLKGLYPTVEISPAHLDMF
ncbi:transferase [Desulfovibrio ferrophilus]|uniref:Transferase hexapeptide repeat containing protein n=1 Tax=Desulfovibrio ferrophilus TaxID=241368 RepID=A0A2Z6AXN2_9BACT|nr:transferase [Desulfovibrio ferrophilus]BBD08014.1 transferase hexapeptide repeat containing protein [Desulfovibrio ferrophilus]